MKTPTAYVITIMDLPQSVEAAQRCIASGAKFGVEVEMWPAVTPHKGNLASLSETLRVSFKGFLGNRYSRLAPCVACFFSHHGLWAHCDFYNEPLIVLEHDAVFVAPLPDLSGNVGQVVNLGRPSFGSFKTPPRGIGPLASKPFFPGAHGYFLKPRGALDLLAKARTEACPTDTFLSLKRFPFLREAYPWPIVCEETFSTIQKEAGCVAKHRTVTII